MCSPTNMRHVAARVRAAQSTILAAFNAYFGTKFCVDDLDVRDPLIRIAFHERDLAVVAVVGSPYPYECVYGMDSKGVWTLSRIDSIVQIEVPSPTRSN